jgi:hypothetical protein
VKIERCKLRFAGPPDKTEVKTIKENVNAASPPEKIEQNEVIKENVSAASPPEKIGQNEVSSADSTKSSEKLELGGGETCVGLKSQALKRQKTRKLQHHTRSIL